MVKNDNEKLNNDDWLAKEIAREKKISAWDLDEGKNLRAGHEENCEARQVAKEHEVMHNRRKNIASGKPETDAIGWFVIDIVAMFVLFMLSAFTSQSAIAPAILLFLSINPGIFIWLFIFKRFPSKAYLKTVFILALLLELYLLFEGDLSYFRYLIWRYFR